MAIGPVSGRIDRRVAAVAALAALSGVAALALFWPGYVAYDSVAQYRQAIGGSFDDWHPPAMAGLWSLFGAAGPGPMLAVQMGCYWLGFGLLAAALAAGGRVAAAIAILAVALCPPLLGWQAVVLKDTQMLGALLAATGIVGWWRLRGRRVPAIAMVLAALALGYAALVRANGVFAVVPLAVMLADRPRVPLARFAIALAGIALAIGVSGPINHRLFGAAPSGVERTQAIYDLAAIGAGTGDARTGLAVDTLAALRAKGCVRPFFWDPLGEPARCAAEVDGWRALPAARLYPLLAIAVLRHPVAYASHRLAHLNSTDRWLVPFHWYGAAPPQGSEPNDYGFGEPGAAARGWQGLAGALVETPLGWPILWIVLGIGGVVATRRAADAPARLARALFVSALALEASFAAISIASDLRYHLWAIVAVALGWILVGAPPRGRILIAGILVVLATGLGARVLLPEPPQSYHGMLG